MADTLNDAQSWFKEAQEALSDQRRQCAEDLEFSDPSNPKQWDDEERRQRENDPGGARPCLTMDQTGQYTATVVGQVEQSSPSLHALPAGAGADQKVAEQLDGHFRHIEYSSRALLHYMRALTSAARAGVGYLILRPEYTDRALNYQEPRIGSEGDPLRVLFDPWSVEIDGSDADRAQVLTAMSYAAFERQFGAKEEKVSFGETEVGTNSDTRDSVLIAEEWRVEKTARTMIVAIDASGEEFSLSQEDFEEARQRPRPPRFVREYQDKCSVVKWVRMSGASILTAETEYPASGIGVVPVYGYTGWADGRMKYCGIPRRARDAQRAYNYHVSEIRAYMNAAPKSPWIASVRAIAGLEKIWDRASVDSRAYLPWNDVDEEGAPVSPPQRAPLGVNLQNYIAGAQQAVHDIQASLGMYQATIGAPSNETSGVAIDARKQQGEAATSIFPSNLAASVAQVGKLSLEMIPRLIDTKRQMRILGIDQMPGHVVMDPGQAEAIKEAPDGLSINPNIGRYDARVVVGAPFSTQRQQAQQAFTEMMRANKELSPALAPLWAGTLDIPNADKLQQVLIAMAPDPVKAILQPEGSKGPTTADLQAKVQQLTEQLQQAVQIAHAAQADADQAHHELASKVGESKDKGTALAIDAYNAETARMKAELPAFTAEQLQPVLAQTIQQMLASPDPWPGEAAPQAGQAMQPPGIDPAETAAPQPQQPPQAPPAEPGAMQ